MSTTFSTWDDLAAALNVPVRELYRERKLPGAPEAKDLDAWREYFQAKSFIDLSGLTPTTYDDRLKTGKLDLESALVHSRLVEQEIINERRREELKKARGDTIPKDKVDEKVRTLTAFVLEVLAELPEMAANAAPSADKPVARRLAKEWVDVLRTRLAEKLRLG
jgi:hypothetical protein